MKAQQLQRDMALVMVHREHGIKLTAQCADEYGIAGYRPAHVLSALAVGFDRGGNHLGVLAAEQPAFAGVRIERGHAHPRTLDPESAERRKGQFQNPRDARGRYERRDLRKRDVRRDMRDAELVVGEKHAGVTAAGEVGKHVGVARIGMTGQVNCLLGNRTGHNRIDPSTHGVVDGPVDRGKGQSSRIGGDSADFDRSVRGVALDEGDIRPKRSPIRFHQGGRLTVRVRRIEHCLTRAIDQRHLHGATISGGNLGQRLDDDLRSDTGGIPHGDGDTGQGFHLCFEGVRKTKKGRKPLGSGFRPGIIS